MEKKPVDVLVRDARKPEISLVRELGFDTEMYLDGTRETVFFIGPHMNDGAERGDHATEEAVLEFIKYLEHTAETARLYLANGRNNKTHEWKVKQL